MQKLRIKRIILLGVVLLMVIAAGIALTQYNTTPAALVPTGGGIVRIDGNGEPERHWTWQSLHDHLLLYQNGEYSIVDGETMYYPHRSTDIYLIATVSYDKALGRKAFSGTSHIRPDTGYMGQVSGLDEPIYVRNIDTGTSLRTQAPVWTDADPCFWKEEKWVYTLALTDDAQLCVVATKSGVNDERHKVSDFLPWQEGDFSLADVRGRPCVLRRLEDGSLQRWTLRRTSHDESFPSFERKPDQYEWVEQPTLDATDYPALVQPHLLDLSRANRPLLYLNEDGLLCAVDLEPGAVPEILDETTAYTAEELAQAERYGHAIVFPMERSTRVYYPKTNLFGMTKWLRYDLG